MHSVFIGILPWLQMRVTFVELALLTFKCVTSMNLSLVNASEKILLSCVCMFVCLLAFLSYYYQWFGLSINFFVYVWCEAYISDENEKKKKYKHL